jgi:hypothetical protein
MMAPTFDGGDDCFYPAVHVLLEVAFPEADDQPAESFEFSGNETITIKITP